MVCKSGLGKSGCIRPKVLVVVFGQNWLYSGNVVLEQKFVFGQSGCIRAKVLFGQSSGKSGYILQKWLYSDKEGLVVVFGVSPKVLYSGKSRCFRPKFEAGKNLFGQKLYSANWLYSKWLYLGKSVVFLQNGSGKSVCKVVVFGQK